MDTEFEVCSYCEHRTATWCTECFGCKVCCPDGKHCDICGQSLSQCERTLCGGMAAFVAPVIALESAVDQTHVRQTGT